MRSIARSFTRTVAAIAVGAVGFAIPAYADSIPPGWEARQMEPVGYTDVGGRKGAFKMAIKKTNGRWYMYLSHLWHYGWSIVDVTDPSDPKLVKFISGASNTWNIQVTLHDNLMLTALQKSVPAWGGDPSKPQDEGVLIWDIANPEDPKQLRTGRPERVAPIAIPIPAASTPIWRRPCRASAARSSSFST